MICQNCGTNNADTNVNCSNCGAPLYNNAPVQGQPVQQGYGNPYLNIAGLKQRNLALAIVLSIVTCGIYELVWFVLLTDEVNQITNRQNEMSGGITLLLSIVTCGIFYFIWAYKMGEKVDQIKGTPSGSSNVLYLILSLFGLGWVALILAQDAVNKILPMA